MHTLADIAKALNRPAVVISGLQDRFEDRFVKGSVDEIVMFCCRPEAR